MYKFAVCRYDDYLIHHNFEDNRNDIKEILAVFYNYKDAYNYYMDCIKNYGNIDNNLWIVFIEDGKAVQFERAKFEVLTRFRNINSNMV